MFTNVDTRTQTSFGTLRTFSAVRAEVNTNTNLATNTGIIAIDSGFIQWGGFTIGRAGTSYFDNPWVYAVKWAPNGAYGWPDTAGGRFVAAYTHQFGNGISATLSVEDNKERKRGNYNGANALSALGSNAPATDTRGGNTWPEIVGQLRIDQAWGGFHIAGNIINNQHACRDRRHRQGIGRRGQAGACNRPACFRSVDKWTTRCRRRISAIDVGLCRSYVEAASANICELHSRQRTLRTRTAD